MLKYRISAIFPEPRIDMVEILRETEEYVFLKAEKTKHNTKGESKERKFSKWYEFYDTWAEAHVALENKVAQRINGCKTSLSQAFRTETAIAAMVKQK